MKDPFESPVWAQGHHHESRPSLDGDTSADVVVVGAGYSGLWLAYWLSEFDPRLDVVVLESRRVGFGASGRNGGWASALLPVSLTTLAGSIGEGATVRLQTEMFHAVRDIGRICQESSIDCHFHRGGTLSLVRNEFQRERALADQADFQRFGFEDHVDLLDDFTTRSRIAHDGESIFRPDCAAIQPRRLVDGLADLVERRGARIFEGTAATEIERRRAETASGSVRGPIVIDCREAYGAPDSRRRIVPIHSLMIATETLKREVWEAIGLADRETFTDHRHQLVYGQRTADDRIAFGGRGVGYHFGSRLSDSFDLNDRVHRGLERALVELFPVLEGVTITHRWGGPLAAPRDWTWTVDLDPASGLGVTGGYVGDGVTSAFVAGRAMAEAIVHGHTDFPLFGHQSPRWEPEPLRFVGINALARIASRLDEHERQGRRSQVQRWIFDRLVG